jgi:Secretion system C-terminal sorting domain
MGAICLCIALACFGGELHAQIFQYHYGGENNEAGRGGVRPVVEGGYVAVGESFTPNAGATSDIYVLRTNDDGTRAWSQTYNIGGNDSALDVEQILTADGTLDGFIVCGVTERTEDPCTRNRDIFLLRLDRCGNINWVNTYGLPETDEIGWDLVITRLGTDECKTAAGDFVVVGSSARPRTPLDGYILRVRDQPFPNLIWARTYNILCDNDDDYFYGVTEAITDKSGDIIAVGGSRSRSCGQGFGGSDAVIARVSGCDGSSISVAAYGDELDQDLRSVAELNRNCIGNIVATGQTQVIREDGSIDKDVYLIETRSDPCAMVGDLRIGDINDDEGYCIREAPKGHPDDGLMVVTGYMTLPGGLGRQDMFLQRFRCGVFGIVPPFTMLYGRKTTDWGWSVFPVLDREPCRTAGYIATGFTNSFTFPDEQLYLIKTDAGMRTGCNEAEVEPRREDPPYEGLCVDPRIERREHEEEPRIEQRCQFWERLLCYEATGTKVCTIRECECTHGGGFGKPGENNRISFGGVSVMSPVPNPMQRGRDMTLEYTMEHDANATVTVSDLNGKVIYRHTGAFKAGNNSLPIGTQGWATGAYLVNVIVGDHSSTKRIVISDK